MTDSAENDKVIWRGQGLKGAKRHPEKAKNEARPQPKRPDWLRVKAPVSQGYQETRDIVREHNLVTVCEEASCPNIGECWQKKHATMMILGLCAREPVPFVTWRLANLINLTCLSLIVWQVPWQRWA